MNQVSNTGSVEVVLFKDLDNPTVNLNTIVSKTLEKHYLNLGKTDLNNLSFNFLKNFKILFEASDNKKGISKLYENIAIYFDFIDENLAVYTESKYKQLTSIIKVASIIMKTGVRLNSFHHFYEGYISLRDNINKCKLLKDKYDERKISY